MSSQGNYYAYASTSYVGFIVGSSKYVGGYLLCIGRLFHKWSFLEITSATVNSHAATLCCLWATSFICCRCKLVVAYRNHVSQTIASQLPCMLQSKIVVLIVMHVHALFPKRNEEMGYGEWGNGKWKVRKWFSSLVVSYPPLSALVIAYPQRSYHKTIHWLDQEYMHVNFWQVRSTKLTR